MTELSWRTGEPEVSQFSRQMRRKRTWIRVRFGELTAGSGPMSFFKSLFGGGKPGATGKRAEHKGFTIEAAVYPEGGQFQLAGVISKEINGAVKQYRYVRADRFASASEAADRALDKGRQIIDEQGDKVFG